MSRYNFEEADVPFLFACFDKHESECRRLIDKQLPLPAYEQVLKASHTFNLLDARHAISVTERQRFILRVRTLARAVAQSYYDMRRALGFPLAAENLRRELLAAGRLPMSMETLLIEIGTEELPPTSLRTLGESLHRELLARSTNTGSRTAPRAGSPARAGSLYRSTQSPPRNRMC